MANIVALLFCKTQDAPACSNGLMLIGLLYRTMLHKCRLTLHPAETTAIPLGGISSWTSMQHTQISMLINSGAVSMLPHMGTAYGDLHVDLQL